MKLIVDLPVRSSLLTAQGTSFAQGYPLDLACMIEKIAVEIGDWLPAPAKAIRPMFAIGDVHGRDDLFGPLIETIEGLVLQDGLTNTLLVTLGDYIDRGPGNIKALNRALDGCDNTVMNFIALPGNHEQFLYTFLERDGSPALTPATSGSTMVEQRSRANSASIQTREIWISMHLP